jgi:aminopeptidase N
LSKKKLIIVSVLVLLSLLFIINLNSIQQFFLYFDSQNVTTLSNFSVTKEEIRKHFSSESQFINVDSIKINIKIDMWNKSINETEKIYFTTGKDLNPVFNLNNQMIVDKAMLNSAPVSFTHKENLIRIDKTVSQNKTAILSLKIKGKPETGIYFYDKDSTEYLYTINEPISASGWFACNDTPSDKFYFTLTATVDSNYQLISNGRKISDIIDKGRREVIWKTSYPIASYLTAIYAGKYKSAELTCGKGEDGINIEVYSYPEDFETAKKIIQIEKDAVNVLQNFYGEFPFSKDKLAIVEIPWNYGGIENQTAIGIGEDYFRSPDMFTELFVHETAHEWWGNAAGISSWDDIWIDEGMANYSQALYWKKTAGEKAFASTMFSMLDNALQKGKIRSRRENLFAHIVYDKSAWLFRMLNYELGDSLFFKSLKKYLSLYKYKNGNAQKLKNVFENVSGRNLEKFFKEWVWNESGFLRLSCSYNFNADSSEVTLLIKQNSSEKYLFTLPVNFYSKGEGVKTINYKINSADTTIPVSGVKCDSVAFDPDYTLLRKPF